MAHLRIHAHLHAHSHAPLPLISHLPTLQFCYLPLTILALLPLSLPIDGGNWSANFQGWGAGWWAVLAVNGSVVYLGGNFALQVSQRSMLCLVGMASEHQAGS